jgi:hypothetical protein
MFHIPRRCSSLGANPKVGFFKPPIHDRKSNGCRDDHQRSEKCLAAHSVGHSFGVPLGPKGGLLISPVRKVEKCAQRVGQVGHPQGYDLPKMAAILGQVRSFLVAMPFLRAFTDKMLLFVIHNQVCGWDQRSCVPPSLKQEVLEVHQLVSQWGGRPFEGRCQVRHLASDSSDLAWAGLDLGTGLAVQDFWRAKSDLHINVKELDAAVSTVKSLAHPGDRVHLRVDNSVAFSYLRKGGGRLPHLNALMRDLWVWCMGRGITLEPQLVKSAEQEADGLSRPLQDRGDYGLDPVLCHQLFLRFSPVVRPKIDMFASPGNSQLPEFCARTPHWGATLVDALHCSLNRVQSCYANPPWPIIHPWLNRLRENPTLTCLMVVPYWDSTVWWLLKLHVLHTPWVVVQPFHGMFRDCWGHSMPPPRWPLLCTVLSGAAFREGKFRMRGSRLTWGS